MRILFMGTPDFAAAALRTIVKAGFEVVGAVSQPDKPKGRGHKLQPTDVKLEAQESNIPVFQPQMLKNGELEPILNDLKPDMIVVAAYGKILPEYIINYPKYGCINIHASLLPKYRGAAPIQWAIINGEKITGITTMKMDKGLDTGDILLKCETEIEKYETAEHLFDRLAKMGGELIVKTIKEINEIEPIPQNHEEHSYAPMISRDTGVIDWNKPTEQIINLIYGLNSWPLAHTYYKGEPLKIAEAVEADGKGEPGKILALDKNCGLKVATGDGAIYIKTAQFKGSKRMNIEDYARGHEIETGIILG